MDHGEAIGAVVRTRAKVKPVFVSAGHRCDLESAVAVVLGGVGKYRMPEASRMADAHVNVYKTGGAGPGRG